MTKRKKTQKIKKQYSKKIKKKQNYSKKIHEYICKKKDICCEENFDRKIIIQQIIDKYKEIFKIIEPGEYLNWINNDLGMLIGFKIDMEKNKDIEGIKLSDTLNKAMFKNKKVNQKKIELLLESVPLYFLLSFLGYATYKEKIFS
jgi:hypothetical protein